MSTVAVCGLDGQPGTDAAKQIAGHRTRLRQQRGNGRFNLVDKLQGGQIELAARNEMLQVGRGRKLLQACTGSSPYSAGSPGPAG